MDIKISGFYDEISGNLDKQIAEIKKLKESYLCPRTLDGKNIADYTAEEFSKSVLPRLKKEGIKFSSIGSPIGKISIDDEEGFSKQLKSLKELIEIAKLMDCKYIRVFSFFYNDKDPDSIFDQAADKFKKFLEIAKDSGVKLMHENEKQIFGDTPERVLKLYNALKCPEFTLCYDASNFIQCSVDPVKAFDMLKDYVEYYHIKDCGRYNVEVPLGLGLGNYKYILGQLAKNDYSGFMTLEPHTFKYSLFKLPVYLMPLGFLVKKYFRTFRDIDKAKKIGFLKRINRTEVFEWQYFELKELLKKVKED